MSIILLIVFIAACLAFDVYAKRHRRRVVEKSPILNNKSYQLKHNRVAVPQGIYFGKQHTWAYLMENGLVRLGLDDFLKHIVGKITGVDVNPVDGSIEKGMSFVDIEQDSKRLKLATPVSGRVKNINSDILDNPQHALRLPHNDRWIVEVEPADWEDDVKDLFLGRGATNWIQQEFARLKEFFAYLMSATTGSPAVATILQDGGEVAEGVLEYSDSSTWEKFQAEFLSNPIE